MCSSVLRARLPQLLVPLLIAALVVPLMGKKAKDRLPRNRPLSAATERRLAEAEELASRSEADWAAMEERYARGQVTLRDVEQLRIRWAATGSPRYAESEWPLRLIEGGMATFTAVRLCDAVRQGDLEAIDTLIEDLASTGQGPGVELRMLQVAANWGLGREGRGAVLYKEVLDSGGMFNYYDATLEAWLRHRAAEAARGEYEPFRPSDADKVEALRKDFHGRGHEGQFLLWFLEPGGEVSSSAIRVGSLEDEVVEELFANHRVDWHFCYAHQGGEDALGSGSLSFDFGVDPYGRVEFCSVTPNSTLRDSDLRRCCCDVVEQIRFPIPDGGGMASLHHTLDFPVRR